jgi:competence protein ComEA
VPRSRRKPAAGEVAAVAARLERLRAGPTPHHGGWAPSSELTAGPADDAPPSVGAVLAARLPASVRGGVFDPGRRGVVVLGVVALLAALAAAWYFTAARPAASAATAQHPPATAPATAPDPQSTSPSAGALTGWPTGPPSSASMELIVIDVVGKVAAPGVVELPPGARIRDAITAAGGALPGTDLTALDLASKLTDGQQLFVGIPPPTGPAAQAAGGLVGGEPAGGGGPGAAGASSGVVNLNTATLAQLETLPGVGPVLAQHILDWRGQHGRFASVSQLQQVSGIGPSKYAALAGRVSV